MIIRINNVGAAGIIKDLPPNELPPEAWSDGLNMRFEGRHADKIFGNEAIYNITVGGSTATQGLAESPWFLLPVQTDTDYFWVYAGKEYVYAANNTANSLNLNKLDSTASATLTYSATPTIRWNGGVLSGLPILNNGVNPPQIWLSTSVGTRLQDLQWDASAVTSWADRTAGAVIANVFRTYREFGIAINTTENSIPFKRRLRWSHPATPRAAPETWDEARTDKDAGYKDFDETTDEIVDGLALRDLFIVYKQNSVWAMQYTGGAFVHQFRQLFPSFGIMAANCVVEVNGTHVVLTDNDLVQHDGQTVRSIFEDKWREFFFSSIDGNYFTNTFLVKDLEEDEVWVCYPEAGSAEPYWCTKALVWNWHNETFSLRSLPKVSHIGIGRSSFVAGSAAAATWITVSGDWDSYAGVWGGDTQTLLQREMIGAYPEDMSATGSATFTVSQPGNTAKLLRMNTTNQFLGSNFSSYLSREGLTLAAQDRFGSPRVDLQDYKYVRRLWPHIRAVDGTVITIQIGSQKHPTDTITWSPNYTYTVGTDEYINCRVMGRLISVKFSNSDGNHWTITGYDLDVDLAGRH